MNVPKTITQLLWRVIVFLGLFVGITGVIGPRIIDSDILFRDGFGAYGGIGKAAIFGLIAFVLLARHNKVKVNLQPWHLPLLGWGAVALVMLSLAWFSIDNLIAGQRHVYDLTMAHAGLWLGIGAAALACFGLPNMVALWRAYQRELIRAVLFAIAFYIFLLAVYALWQPLASVVTIGVNFLLGISGLHADIVPPHTLLFDKFGITIAEYCSGIESIALFSSLYAVVGMLDWNRINARRYFAVFPFALLVLFALNIVRVYGLIMAGYYIDPVIAFSLFHTYAGMVFFILYSAVFWALAYKHLLKKEPSVSANETT